MQNLGAKLSAGHQTPEKQKKPGQRGLEKINNEIILKVDAVFKLSMFYSVTISLHS